MTSFAMTLLNDWQERIEQMYESCKGNTNPTHTQIRYEPCDSINKWTKSNLKKRMKQICALIMSSEVIAETEHTTTYKYEGKIQ